MAESKQIRVMLVDDHAVVRSGLGAFLMAFDDLDAANETYEEMQAEEGIKKTKEMLAVWHESVSAMI